MDLVSGIPFWPVRDGLPGTFPPLARDERCAVAVLGAGLTGAFSACLLAEAGVDVVVIDQRDAAQGSTSACTALLIVEPDLPLRLLERRIGSTAAARAYRESRDAVPRIRRIAASLGDHADFAWRESIQLARTPSHATALCRECTLRQHAGLEIEFWGRRRLASESSLPHRAALVTRGAAQLDPYRLTHALLARARERGARVRDRTRMTHWQRTRNGGVEVATDRGFHVRADKLVIATGYEAQRHVRPKLGSLHSTYAMITEPLAAAPGWPGDRLLWDTGQPYLYLRRCEDRIIVGGYDEPFQDPARRDALLPSKSRALLRALRRFFPAIDAEIAYAWTGTFADTGDSLPYIGEVPGQPGIYVALGYGGNGVIFSLLAAEIIRDLHLGQRHPAADLFRFGR